MPTPQFILKGVDGFGRDDAHDLHYYIFLGYKHVVRSILEQFIPRHHFFYASGEGG
jgi:hypothetical protein